MRNIKLISKEWGEYFPHSTLEECIEYCRELKYISLDTETQGFDPHTKELLTLQIGDKNTQFIIDVLTTDITLLKPLLESKIILMHNAKFDFRFLYKKGIDIKNIFDTFLAEVILYTGYNLSKKDKDFYISTNLEGVVKKYCNYSLDKSIRGDIHKGITKEVLVYSAEDIEYLEDVKETQTKLLEEYDLLKVMELENKVVRVFALMEYTGINFNVNKINEVISELNKINEEISDNLDNIIFSNLSKYPKLKNFTKVQLDLFDEVRKLNINWSSPDQKKKILNILGISVDGVSDKILQKNKNAHAIVPAFIEFSKYAKLSSSFGEPLLKFINPVTKRIHAGIWQILQTGRISMSEPKQNWAA